MIKLKLDVYVQIYHRNLYTPPFSPELVSPKLRDSLLVPLCPVATEAIIIMAKFAFLNEL